MKGTATGHFMKASPAVLFLILKSQIWVQVEKLNSLVGANKGTTAQRIQLQAERTGFLQQETGGSCSSNLVVIEFF
jgi:hypothetical protein